MTSQQQPQQQQPMDGERSRFSPRESKASKATVAIATAIPRLAAWATGGKGSKALMGLGAAYCLALSAEAWFVTLPTLTGQPPATENRRFVPKPFINDGADLGLLNPLNAIPTVWDAAMGVLEAVLPFQLKGAVPEPVRCVWLDWRFYVAVLLSVVVQTFQAKALRSLTVDQRLKKAQALQRYKRMSLDPKAIDIANARAAEYNKSLMGKRRGMGLGIVTSYGVEAWMGWSAITGNVGIPVTTAIIYTVVQMFGFEFFLSQMNDDDNA
jgi:hypothetical protein